MYDYLALARGRLFEWIRPLGAEAYARVLPTWRRSLGQTLVHVMIGEWYYVERIEGRDLPPYAQWPIREEDPLSFTALESEWTEQAARTTSALSAVRDWDADLEYRIIDDDGRPQIVTASPAEIFTQLVLHEVHHRAQR